MWGMESWDDAEMMARARPHRRPAVGISREGCVAIPNLSAGTVTTIKDTGPNLLAGIWQITGQRPVRGGLAVSVSLPATVTINKASGQCQVRPQNLSHTFRARSLQGVLDEAAAAWCRTV